MLESIFHLTLEQYARTYENPKRHGGDLGNVVADENGEVHIQKGLPGLTIYQLGRTYSILGRNLILHKKADDLKS